jgi:ADP-heptose:LPS heptosyltransferase
MKSITEKVSQNKIVYLLIKTSLSFYLNIFRYFSKLRGDFSGNVIIIALHKLGDAVFTIAAILEIQKNYNKKIIIFCYPEVVPIYKLGLNNVDFCEVEHRHFYFNDRYANRKARKLLEKTKPEIIFDLTGVMTSATLIFNSRAKEIIGMNREHFKSIYDYYSHRRSKPHLIDTYLDAVSSKIPIPDTSRLINLPRKTNPNGKILIHPFAGWKAKEWNLNKFIELAYRLKDEYKVCLILPDKKISNDIINVIESKGIPFVQTISIQDLVDKIRECSVFIGNDSGPVYIAAFLGKPTFTIYGPTNPDFSLMPGEHHTFMHKKLKCSPGKHKQYCFTNAGQSGCPAFLCMDLLELNVVYNNVYDFLQNYCSKNS